MRVNSHKICWAGIIFTSNSSTLWEYRDKRKPDVGTMPYSYRITSRVLHSTIRSPTHFRHFNRLEHCTVYWSIADRLYMILWNQNFTPQYTISFRLTCTYIIWLCLISHLGLSRPTTLDPRPSTLDLIFFIVLFWIGLIIKFENQYQVNVGSPSAMLA